MARTKADLNKTAAGLQPKRVAVQKSLPWAKNKQGPRTPPLTGSTRKQGKAQQNKLFKEVAFYTGLDENLIRKVYHGVLDCITTNLIICNEVTARRLGWCRSKCRSKAPRKLGNAAPSARPSPCWRRTRGRARRR